MKIYPGKLSDPGMSGKNNEDNLVINTLPLDNGESAYLAVVADGIGGHNAGEIASKMAVDTASDDFAESDLNDPLAAFARIIKDINTKIFDRAQNNPQFNGMGTTLAIALVRDNTLYAAGVGDSRIYLIPQNGKPIQVTLDHTWAQEAIDAKRLTPAQAKRHPNRNVLRRYLGILPEVEVDDKVIRKTQTLREGDSILLCSDGLTDLVQPEELGEIVNGNNPQDAAAKLIALANERGGHDNITAVILKTTETLAAAPIAAATQAKGGGNPVLLIAGVLVALVVVALVAWVLFGQTLLGAQTNVVGTPSVTPVQTQVIAAPTNAESTPSTVTAPVGNDSPTQTLVPTITPIPTSTFTLVPTRRPPTVTGTATVGVISPSITPGTPAPTQPNHDKQPTAQPQQTDKPATKEAPTPKPTKKVCPPTKPNC